MTMNTDLIDALTMVPGIVMAHGFAWSSDDFMFKTSVLAWVWVCVCSMVYHLNWCDGELLKYDLRAQWVAQAVMSLCSPQSTWPIVLGGFAPVGIKGRIFLNGLGAYHFLRHTRWGGVWLAVSYMFYISQYVTRKPWMHSVFHLSLHCGGACGALQPLVKFPVPISGKWAYVVEFVGLMMLLPKRGAWKAIRNLANLWDRRQSGKTLAFFYSKKPDAISGPAPTPTTTVAAVTCNEEASA